MEFADARGLRQSLERSVFGGSHRCDDLQSFSSPLGMWQWQGGQVDAEEGAALPLRSHGSCGFPSIPIFLKRLLRSGVTEFRAKIFRTEEVVVLSSNNECSPPH